MTGHDKVLAIGLPEDQEVPNIDFNRGDIFSILTIDLQEPYKTVVLNPSASCFMRYQLRGQTHQCSTKHRKSKYFKSDKDGLCKLLLHRKYAHRQCIKKHYDAGLQKLATKHASLVINKLFLSMTSGTNVVILNNPKEPDHFLCRYQPELPLPYLGKSKQTKCNLDHPILDAFKGDCMSKLGSLIYSEPMPAVSTIRDILLRDEKTQARYGSDLSGKYYGLEGALSSHIVLQPAFTNLTNQATSIIGLPEKSDGSLMIIPLQLNMTPVLKRLSRAISKPCRTNIPNHSTPSMKPSPSTLSSGRIILQDDPEPTNSLHEILSTNLVSLAKCHDNPELEKELSELTRKYDDLSDDMQHAIANVLRVFSDKPKLYQMYIYNQQGLTQEEIGKKLGCDKGTVSRHLNKLEKDNPGIKILRRTGGSDAVGNEYKHNTHSRRKS